MKRVICVRTSNRYSPKCPLSPVAAVGRLNDNACLAEIVLKNSVPEHERPNQQNIFRPIDHSANLAF